MADLSDRPRAAPDVWLDQGFRAMGLPMKTLSRVQAVGCFFPPTDLLNFGGPADNIADLM
jgi:hypothetical protein